MKTCVRCCVEKPTSDFHNLSRSRDGRAPHCKACDKISRDRYNLEHPEAALASDRKYKEKRREEAKLYARKYRADNRDKFLASCKRAKDENPVKYLLSGARSRARIKGLEFSITENDIHIPTHCPVFGFPIKQSPERRSFDSPSIDRIDSEIGYVPGNVAVISYRANMIKSVGTAEDHEAVAKWIRNVRHGAGRNPRVRAVAREARSPVLQGGE